MNQIIVIEKLSGEFAKKRSSEIWLCNKAKIWIVKSGDQNI